MMAGVVAGGILVATLLSGIGLGCQACAGYHAGSAWDGYEETALLLGKMRLDRRPDGIPVSNLALADNFRRIAFGTEEDVIGRAPTGHTAPDPRISEGGRLRRWQRPVRWQITSLGRGTAENVRAVTETVERLSEATGHDIARSGPKEQANFIILFLRPQDYAPAAVALRRQPGGNFLAAQVDRFGRAANTPCVGLFLHARQSGTAGMVGDEILFGFAIIRDGLPPRLARSCVEEELAQAMGLPNDDPNVRPSIFNDDQEFALLTRHDEALLRILYDPRLAPGMTEREAMAIVPRIIEDMDTGVINGRDR